MVNRATNCTDSSVFFTQIGVQINADRGRQITENGLKSNVYHMCVDNNKLIVTTKYWNYIQSTQN